MLAAENMLKALAEEKDTENYKEVLVRVKDSGLKGIKLHPDYQATFFRDIRYKRIVEKATEVEELLAGQDVYMDTAFSFDCMPGVKGMLTKE